VISADHFWLLAAALLLDAAFGDPEFLWARAPHPVVVLGALVGFADRQLNREHLSNTWRRVLGAIAVLIVVEIAVGVGFALEAIFARVQYGWYGTMIVASVLLAGRSLYDHVAAVAKAFASGIDAARAAVSQIVGRDPASLDEARICRAAIESTAENFSDAVVAPALWFLAFGLPGLFAYKAINTADSMIGHLTDRYKDFGWAAARLDDLVNLPASRLSGLLIAIAAPLAGGDIGTAFRAMMKEARRHRSPNAGWPEAAMAAALGVALAGPRRYGGIIVNDPFLNDGGRREATPDDIRRALRVYLGANALFFAIVAVVAGAIAFWR
jgi:adenosylcobinamide-phosphate synthase